MRGRPVAGSLVNAPSRGFTAPWLPRGWTHSSALQRIVSLPVRGARRGSCSVQASPRVHGVTNMLRRMLVVLLLLSPAYANAIPVRWTLDGVRVGIANTTVDPPLS